MIRLVLLAHPDDEFAIFPLLEDRRRPTHVAWLTDGGWGNQSIELRRHESTAVLRRMGVPLDHMHFLGHDWSIADGTLHRQLDHVVPRLLTYFAWIPPKSEVILPAWEGGHPDHDATHLAGVALAAHLALDARQFSLYHGEGLAGPLFKVLTPLLSNGRAEIVPTTFLQRLRYVRECLRYRSQWKSFVGLLPFYAWRMRRADAFALQWVMPGRTAQAPHQGTLLYERRGGPSWRDFAEATRRFRSPFTWQQPLAPPPETNNC